MPGAVIPVLPTSLALLLHLHILSYPRCTSSEYSTLALFAPARPLRDRTKTMEDIVAFLIEQIEGSDKCKLILNGTYPCLRASDSVTFRMCASKYIECLRNSVIRLKTFARAPAAKRPTREQHRGNSPTQASHVTAWWTEVVVRKSLLEECSGNRIEKLLLALSTHAIFVKLLATSLLQSDNQKISEMTEMLVKLPEEYSSVLFQSVEAHACRIRRASQLNARASSLISLRSRLAMAPQSDHSSSIDLSHLLDIRDAARKEALRTWRMALGQTGSHSIDPEQALDWFLTMVGVSAPNHTPENVLKLAVGETGPVRNDSSNVTTQTTQLLPIAAAHHPANLRKLSSLPPLISLRGQSPSAEDPQQGQDQKLPSVAMQGWFDNTAEQLCSLEGLLTEARRQGEYLSSKLAVCLENQAIGKPDKNDKLPFRFWTPEKSIFSIDLNTANVADEATKKYQNEMAIPISFCGDESQIEDKFEADVLNLRESLFPKFPVPGVPDMELLDEETPEAPVFYTSRPPSTGYTTSKASPRTQKRTTMLVTPRNNRRSTLLPSIMAVSAAHFDSEFLADLSLPDESIEMDESKFPLFAFDGQTANNASAFSERHSMTIRDILLRAGDDDDSFDIVSGGLDHDDISE